MVGGLDASDDRCPMSVPTTTSQEEVMGKAIPSQHHPAVVLRSHSRAVRALLAVAMIAVVGLIAALVFVANDDVTGTTSASPTGQINYGGFNPATGRPASAAPVYVNPSTGYPSTLYDGGSEDGTTAPSR
jgi:hypothetical protein